MKSHEVIVKLQNGISPERACFFIQKANTFTSEINIEYDKHRVNAKSLLGVLSLCIPQNATIQIQAEGVDEDQAIMSIDQYLTAE